MVGDPAIVLLRHAQVQASQPGLHMAHVDAQLGPGEGGGQDRVGIPLDQDDLRLDRQEDGFQSNQRLRRLFGVGTGPDLEVRVGGPEAQLLEEGLGQLPVIMLPRVDEGEGKVLPPQLRDDRSHLHDLRPRAYDDSDVH